MNTSSTPSNTDDGIFTRMKNKFMNLFPSNGSKSNSNNFTLNKPKNDTSGFLNTEGLGTTINAIQERVVGDGNLLVSNYIIVVSFVIAFVTIILLYFLSNSFRTSRTLDAIGMYYQYQSISSYSIPSSSKIKLSDVYVASSYNSALVNYQTFDYVNELVLKSILRAGVRYVEFNIFNSEFGINAIPVVSNGYKLGEWKLTLNVISFDLICSILAENAFSTVVGSDVGVPNPDDPLIIGLNLNTNNNIYCLDKVADSLLFYFRRRMLDTKYTFQQRNMALAPLRDLKAKVVILASDGFQGSKLEELVNGSWNLSSIRRIHYSVFEDPSLNINDWIEYNKQNLTIVVPHNEGDFWTQNFDVTMAWMCGCQLVAMNYQVVASPMDTYITKFKNYGIIPKPPKLRSISSKNATNS
jgi:hypothetical protein